MAKRKKSGAKKSGANPGELLIFGNPKKRRAPKGHKPGCKCFACKKNPSEMPKKRATRDRAARIRAARLNPKKKKVARYRRPHLRPRRNPSEEEQAVRLFQGFHGQDPKEIVEKHVSSATRLDYTALGDLVYLKVETPTGKETEFNFSGDGVKLAISPDGKQLYCIGGNQNILLCLDEDSKQKDFIDLGDGIEVAYLARKIHGKFQPVEYYHEFGEVDGTLPRLMYDKLRKQIFFIGGNYWVDVNMPAPGTPLGKISPGIEN